MHNSDITPSMRYHDISIRYAISAFNFGDTFGFQKKMLKIRTLKMQKNRLSGHVWDLWQHS